MLVFAQKYSIKLERICEFESSSKGEKKKQYNSIIIQQIPSKRSERGKTRTFYVCFLQNVVLIVKFTNLLVSKQFFLLLLDIFYGFNR